MALMEESFQERTERGELAARIANLQEGLSIYREIDLRFNRNPESRAICTRDCSTHSSMFSTFNR
jgi:hypothetical protein